jgi:uncharacterized membrane protein SpoIIM required for sporulation
MSQDGFQRQHQEDWRWLSTLLDELEARTTRPRLPGRLQPVLDQRVVEAWATFPARYRRLCQHLALAQHRRFSSPLVAQLNNLALRGQLLLHRRVGGGAHALLQVLAVDFPRTVRAEWRLVLLAHLFFYGPLVGIFVASLYDPSWIWSVLDPAEGAALEEMYNPASDHYLKEREANSDMQMFGFYIWNNISIAYRTLASGVLFGVGSILILVYNGITIGALAAHITQTGFTEPFFSFVVGHGSFELTAITLAGAAGLRLGIRAFAPQGISRAEALRRAGATLAPWFYGITMMLFIAAALEAFWSSTRMVSAETKYVVGGLLWLGVGAWLTIGGRERSRGT